MQSDIKNILFICRANVGRSQMAEGFYADLRGDSHAGSAGVEDFVQKYHGKPTEKIIKLMAEKNIDITDHSVKQLNSQMLNKYDVAVMLCESDITPEFLRNSNLPILYQEVQDPDTLSFEDMRKVRDQIEQVVEHVDKQLNA